MELTGAVAGISFTGISLVVTPPVIHAEAPVPLGGICQEQGIDTVSEYSSDHDLTLVVMNSPERKLKSMGKFGSQPL